jgi:large subunit ribosomal protein L25
MTTTETLSIDGQGREVVGAKVRFLRREGITPANIYGRGMDSISFQVDTRELEEIVHRGARSSLVNVSIDGQKYSALLRALQRHPVTRFPLHAEFFRVDLTRLIQTQVALHVVGDAPAARLPSAMVSQVMHEIMIECLPSNIPSAFEVDLSPLVVIGDTILVRDLETPDDVAILSEPEQIVVRAGQARVAVEAAEAALGQEGEVPEGSEGVGGNEGSN